MILLLPACFHLKPFCDWYFTPQEPSFSYIFRWWQNSKKWVAFCISVKYSWIGWQFIVSALGKPINIFLDQLVLSLKFDFFEMIMALNVVDCNKHQCVLSDLRLGSKWLMLHNICASALCWSIEQHNNADYYSTKRRIILPETEKYKSWLYQLDTHKLHHTMWSLILFCLKDLNVPWYSETRT